MLRQTTIALAATLLATGAFAQDGSSESEADASSARQEIMKNGSRDGMIGSSDYFTGTAYVEPVFPANDPFAVNAGKVTFLPGARSNWHHHPSGQMLIVTEGTGWTKAEGQERQIMQAGDVVWCPPDVPHWHGATDTTAVTHYAIQQYEDGENVIWGEPVSEDEYMSASASGADGSSGGSEESGSAQ